MELMYCIRYDYLTSYDCFKYFSKGEPRRKKRLAGQKKLYLGKKPVLENAILLLSINLRNSLFT